MTATLLFDLDGTIAETDHLHFEAFQSIFTPHGVAVDWDVYTSRIIGRNNPDIAAEFVPGLPEADRLILMDRKEAAYRERLHAVEAASGLLGLLDWADAEAVPCAVVTNAPRANADAVLAMLDIRHRFKLVVIGPELPQAKPHPLPYLTALDAMGGDAARSVGFEDSRTGIASAAGAGLGVVGIASTFDPEALRQAGAHVAGRDFTDPAILDFVRRRTGR
ncbi:HAD family phosphatase [Lichenihabitans sp. Uapishka_5]|uniref:HAD family hydrolase n=1 Tax=Lichenihabitans sp. Uapishka_5 TaxID=3037302 RepID=UPI0029E7D284|nr:HAD family phosphatase [Lichenihabitans sp. Uapishka_5]MDX7950029.1 HAD family phosphatase [Lichenihabitans sp. Uapishka_5]